MPSTRILSRIRDFFLELQQEFGTLEENGKEKDIGKEEGRKEKSEEESLEEKLSSSQGEIKELSLPEVVFQSRSHYREERRDFEIPPARTNRFWVSSWASVPKNSKNLSSMAWIMGNGIGTSGISERELDELARALRDSPSGRRVLFPWRWRSSLLWSNGFNNGSPDDRTKTPSGEFLDIPSPYADNSIVAYIREVEKVAKALRKRGVLVDQVIVDDESSEHLSAWRRSAEDIEYMRRDPRFSTRVWPNGKTLLEMIGNHTGEEIKDSRNRELLYRWNSAMNYAFNVQLDRALFQTLRTVFPRLKASNYEARVVSEKEASFDMNGHPQHWISYFGTNPAAPFYGEVDQLKDRLFEGQPIGRSGWIGLLAMINQARSMKRSMNTRFHAWVVDSLWKETPLFEDEYERELIFHLALNGAIHFMHWTPFAPGFGVHGTETEEEREERFSRLRKTDEMLSELNSRTRYATPIPLKSSFVEWNSALLSSAARIGHNRVLWRISAKAGIDSISVNGRKMHFPIGQRGIWVELSNAESEKFTILSAI
jgi:hypothetical protein